MSLSKRRGLPRSFWYLALLVVLGSVFNVADSPAAEGPVIRVVFEPGGPDLRRRRPRRGRPAANDGERDGQGRLAPRAARCSSQRCPGLEGIRCRERDRRRGTGAPRPGPREGIEAREERRDRRARGRDPPRASRSRTIRSPDRSSAASRSRPGSAGPRRTISVRRWMRSAAARRSTSTSTSPPTRSLAACRRMTPRAPPSVYRDDDDGPRRDGPVHRS